MRQQAALGFPAAPGRATTSALSAASYEMIRLMIVIVAAGAGGPGTSRTAGR
ncbi:hypothetical protein AB0L04_03270 [Streptomyces glaucescens]|uniref:hypothetical protein n=1 Tax=Streptomyces glaucescens TaxID=1907 RepID=UPI00344DA97F